MTDLFPKRKPNRLPTFDYTNPGYYFITICTEQRKCILGQINPGSTQSPAAVQLSADGEVVLAAIHAIPEHYPGVAVDHFVIMPNHVHLILALQETGQPSASVSRIVQQLKRAVSMKIGHSIWQAHFHDHVIRGDRDYKEIWD
ncbi:MAG: transposase [Oscillospiraceae bacterium]|nr:transposase [Oscillospiraceae bacterium]